MDRRLYYPVTAVTLCEHCDSERSNTTRNDYLRGYICPDCDYALDAMEIEEQQ